MGFIKKLDFFYKIINIGYKCFYKKADIFYKTFDIVYKRLNTFYKSKIILHRILKPKTEQVNSIQLRDFNK